MPVERRAHKPESTPFVLKREAASIAVKLILLNIPDNPGASFRPERVEIGYGFCATGSRLRFILSSCLASQQTAQKHMRTTEILPEVSIIDAILLFRRLGVDVTGMAPDELREARRQLINRHHPDRGGSVDMAQAINAAFDLLKDGVPKYRGSAFAL